MVYHPHTNTTAALFKISVTPLFVCFPLSYKIYVYSQIIGLVININVTIPWTQKIYGLLTCMLLVIIWTGNLNKPFQQREGNVHLSLQLILWTIVQKSGVVWQLCTWFTLQQCALALLARFKPESAEIQVSQQLLWVVNVTYCCQVTPNRPSIIW